MLRGTTNLFFDNTATSCQKIHLKKKVSKTQTKYQMN